jgi:hypothetical protein
MNVMIADSRQSIERPLKLSSVGVQSNDEAIGHTT